jgi:hypothetical protein
MRKILVAAFSAALLVSGVAYGATAASAETTTSPSPTVTPTHTLPPSHKPGHKHFNPCPTVVTHDHLTKTDNGHGTPSEWADLSFDRTVVAVGHINFKARSCSYTITLRDKGVFTTRQGAGSPSGAGVQIAKKVPGKFYGVYHLTLTGWFKPHVQHGDVTAAGSTAFVQSLVKHGNVAGGKYAWIYKTVCGEHWLDASFNNDGQSPSAGNITGKSCRACGGHTPKPTPTPTVPPVVTQPIPGEAAPAVPIVTQPHFTG